MNAENMLELRNIFKQYVDMKCVKCNSDTLLDIYDDNTKSITMFCIKCGLVNIYKSNYLPMPQKLIDLMNNLAWNSYKDDEIKNLINQFKTGDGENE